MQRYNPKEIEPKWQKIWDDKQIYKADLNSSKHKYIAMSMFNYPSGAGIHIGHAMNYTISDVMARYKRQQGYESYHPVGWDAFGLPAENYAIKTGISPQESMKQIIPSYHKQYKAMGWSNDWSKEIATHEPTYYKWTQWIFSQMYKNGLAYQEARMQWWCTKCQTVLANEQVIDGKCWRHDGADDPIIEKKEVKQWFFKITDYADELLEATDALDWSEVVKTAQKNWIGKSKGAEVDFLLHKVSNPHAQMARSYIMGQQNITEDDIFEIGGTVDNRTEAGHLCVEFPVSKADDFERLITDNMETGFWNEYLTNEKVVFIFKHKDGYIERFEFNDSNASQICALGNKFNNLPEPAPNETPWQWLANNSWYSSIVPKVRVFTTRPDTIFGATFLVLAPEHELVEQLTTKEQKVKVDDYIKQATKKTEVERQASKEKTGVFTGSYAINPASGEKIPVWVADYVLVGYGTGAIMAVPAHDERDREFAQDHELPLVQVVDIGEVDDATAEGVMINSGKYDGMSSAEAREKIIADLEKQGLAKEKTTFKIRDWSVSRQRYWGAPIPIINCEKCGQVLVPDEDLPVVLPELDDYAPSGDGRSALARATDWLEVDCPKCGGKGERETDTLDTYICSSWYYLRYFDPANKTKVFDSSIVNKWMPIDFYNGGDHATAHMIYARFITRFFHKIGLLDNPEPFKKFLFNGKVMASDGQMFSKSKGNGVDPHEIINQGYGADALRTYLMFAAPLDLWIRWDPQGVPGACRFFNRVWNLSQEFIEAEEEGDRNNRVLKIMHPAIKKVTEDLEDQKYNTAIASMMKATNQLYEVKAKYGVKKNGDWQMAIESLAMLIAPFAPHTADEIWNQLGHQDSINIDHWPEWDDSFMVQDVVDVVVQVNGKLRGKVQISSGSSQDEVITLVHADSKLMQYIGAEVKKVVYVPDRLVNFVV